jgi:hypothetical protein
MKHGRYGLKGKSDNRGQPGSKLLPFLPGMPGGPVRFLPGNDDGGFRVPLPPGMLGGPCLPVTGAFSPSPSGSGSGSGSGWGAGWGSGWGAGWGSGWGAGGWASTAAAIAPTSAFAADSAAASAAATFSSSATHFPSATPRAPGWRRTKDVWILGLLQLYSDPAGSGTDLSLRVAICHRAAGGHGHCRWSSAQEA